MSRTERELFYAALDAADDETVAAPTRCEPGPREPRRLTGAT